MRKALPVITEEQLFSNNAYNTNMTVARNPGSRCSTCWPAGKPTPARRWPNC